VTWTGLLGMPCRAEGISGSLASICFVSQWT
jgi:hypothetical protein